MFTAFPDLNFLTSDQESKVKYVVGDISDLSVVASAFKGVDAVFHIAAAVGPFIPQPIFHKVNVVGTQNVIDACRQNGVKKLVASSSPSIFFTGQNISGVKTRYLKIWQTLTHNQDTMSNWVCCVFCSGD